MKKEKRIIKIIGVILVTLVLAVLGSCFSERQSDNQDVNIDSEKTNIDFEKTTPAEIESIFDTGSNLHITEISSYSGAYMEDGSDEEVKDIIMIQVENRAELPLQYAEITLTSEEGESLFKLSTLNPGEKVMVLEANRKEFDKKEEFTQAVSENVAFFETTLNTCEDIFQIQGLDGGLNIKNISGEDVRDEIVIYFKDFKDGELMGGITYRGRIENGLRAGEIQQMMSENFTQDHTKVMFVTIAGR